MSGRTAARAIEPLLVAFVFYVSNRRGLLCLARDGACAYSFFSELQMWVVASVLVCVMVRAEGLGRRFMDALQENWPVFLLTIWAAVSLTWTIFWPVTLVKLGVLVGSSLVGV